MVNSRTVRPDVSPAERTALRERIDARARELAGRPLRDLSAAQRAKCEAFNFTGGRRCDRIARVGSRFCGTHERYAA